MLYVVLLKLVMN